VTDTAPGAAAPGAAAPGAAAPDAAAPGAAAASNPPGRAWLRDLLRAAAGPVICAVILTGLLATWVASGGAGTLTRVRLQVTLAAVPMRAFTPQAAAAVGTATTFLTVKNLGGAPDELIAASSPFAGRVVLTEGSGLRSRRTVVDDLVVPAYGTLTLSPFGDDLILMDPTPFETRAAVPLTLTFRHAGTVTIDALVTPPGSS
jgi:copper(I)-binding protein